jgi:O-antigen/teichoic acid export membrane protein
VWFVGGAAAGIVLIALGWREAARQGQLAGFARAPAAWLQGPGAHAGLWRFAVVSNLHTTLQTATGHFTPVLVGAVAGPAAAGLFKIARDVATALTKPAEMLNNAVYPEFARLASQGAWHAFPRLILRGGSIGVGAGLFIVGIAAAAGPWFLATAFGAEFVPAQTAMLLLLCAATLALGGFAFDPALYAMGRPGVSLQVNSVAVALYIPLVIMLAPDFGPAGAGAAALVSAVAVFAATAILTAALVRRRLRAPADAAPPAAPAAALQHPGPNPRSRARSHHSRRDPGQRARRRS